VSQVRVKKSVFKKVKRFFLNFVFVVRWAKKTSTFNADVISCHDLPALVIGYLSNMFKRKSLRSKLVYDSHEFEIGRNVSRNFILAFVILTVERFLIKRSALTVIPCDSTTDEVTRIHKLKIRPTVIRSTPVNWIIDKTICDRQRQEYIKLTHTSSNPFFVMYHGLIKKDRGIEMVIKVTAMNTAVVGIVMGYTFDEGYFNELQLLVDDYKVADRILFLPAVPTDRLWEFVGAVDVGVSLIQNTSESYYFSLPNKFFEIIQSLTPIIASDFPEMKRLIDYYDIGFTCDPANVEDINECVERMRTDKELYLKFKDNLIKAKNELCWEKEKTALVDAYRNLCKD
jgi:glycosyltransferase involved in cell wall biosynthesis